MNVIIAREAIEDLVAIGEYIAITNPERAESFVDQLQTKCLDLADKPHAFARIFRGSVPTDVRRRPFGHYLIFYRMSDDQIDILRVLHGAQDYENILFPDE